MRKIISLLLLVMLLAFSSFPAGIGAASPFRDVKTEHWANKSIQWAYQEGLIKGFPDGTFKPSSPVTEAQFITMINRFDCSLSDTYGSRSGEHFASGIYRQFQSKNIPLEGYTNLKARDLPITRGRVAQVITAFNGYDLSLPHAVQYMYVENLSNGLTGKKDYKDYGVNLSMTRAEAAAFFHRLDKNGSCQFNGLQGIGAGKDNQKYELPLDFNNNGTIVFPKPEVGNTAPEQQPKPSTGRLKEIDIDKETLIANGVDSTFVTISLNDCYGNILPYEESVGFTVTTKFGTIDEQQRYDDFDVKQPNTEFSTAAVQQVYSDGPDVTVKVTAPRSTIALTDTISFQANDRNGNMACYREPVTVSLEYVPQAELRLEVANHPTNIIRADGNSSALITAKVVLPGGQVISNYSGRVRFHSSEGATFSNQEASFYNGTASTYLMSIPSDSLITDVITAEFIQTDTTYNSDLASILEQPHHMEVYYEPSIMLDSSCTLKPELAVIIDSSGSMKQNDPERLRVQKSIELIHTLQADYNIATRFNSGGYLLGTGAPAVVAPTLIPINASGGTNIAKGLEKAFSNFKGEGKKIAILLTDGNSNEQKVLDKLEEAKKKNITIYTIGLGKKTQLKEALLQLLASETGGQYYHVEKNIHIGTAYKSILSQASCGGVPEGSCSFSSQTFTSPVIQETNTDVYMNTFIEDYCGEVASVFVRFESYYGDIDYELVHRGQNYYALKKDIYEIIDFDLFQEGVFLAYDSSGGLIGQKRVRIMK